MIAFSLFGLFFLAGGLFFCWVRKKEIDNAETYPAEVTGIDDKIKLRGHVMRRLYAPIAVIQKNDGHSRQVVHRRYTERYLIKHDVGEKALVRVNPVVPDKFWFADEEQKIDLGGAAAAVGGALLVILGIVLEIIV
ncbi:DUF3592 domain-containing protein [Ruminococcus sp. XPD3002]|uniref:DUF3592 domain-containing protein n=1 Tax=Ruminococcus sp. XPD3002 TaxID=1452269 RepID=UPI0009176572|nr:hypothetical protein SAMN04487832_11170 [Ruminococcus flavefaciens]